MTFVESSKHRFLNFYHRHEIALSILVFVAGFLFDVFTLGRIDDVLNLVQEAVYILILGGLLLLEIKVKLGNLVLTGKLERLWKYHDLLVHFLFGSLLSAYTIFYYTSASALTSFFFILLLAGLMFANEIPRIQRLGLPVRVVLFSICVMSYFAFLYPILLGRVGPLPFWLGFLSSVLVFVAIGYKNFQQASKALKHLVLIPTVAVHLFFLVGYYTGLIPPVPVAVKKIGVYYHIEKSEGQYLGKHLNPWWKLWSKGAQEFLKRPDDAVHVLLAVFSPARFRDQVILRWYHEGNLRDSIPLKILGGRDEGFRGFGVKKNFEPGNWRVIVETSDGREVGRIKFSIRADPTVDEREFEIDVY